MTSLRLKYNEIEKLIKDKKNNNDIKVIREEQQENKIVNNAVLDLITQMSSKIENLSKQIENIKSLDSDNIEIVKKKEENYNTPFFIPSLNIDTAQLKNIEKVESRKRKLNLNGVVEQLEKVSKAN